MWVEKKHFHKNQTNREPDLSGQKKRSSRCREREKERERERSGGRTERERERERCWDFHGTNQSVTISTGFRLTLRRMARKEERRSEIGGGAEKNKKKTKTKQKQSSTWHPARPDGVSRRGVPAEHTHTHTHKTRAWPTFDWKEMAPCSFEDDNDVKKENRKAKVHVRRTVLEPADWHRPLWNSGT